MDGGASPHSCRRPAGRWIAAVLLAGVVCGALIRAQPKTFAPRLIDGVSPALPAQNVAGGQVILEVSVSDTGSVGSVTLLRSSPQFDDLLIDAVRGWRFTPAQVARPDGTRVAAPWPVIVAAVFRPGTFYNGPPLGEPPREVAAASARVPFPISTAVPSYPPLALAGGVVLLEAEVGSNGAPAKIRVAGSGPGFDSAAVDALGQWRFRPASDGSAFAYIVFAFNQPVLADPQERPGR
jgi:TonB family protein